MSNGSGELFVSAVATAIGSSGLLWGFAQWFLTRRERKKAKEREEIEARQQIRKEHQEQLRVERREEELLAEAQAISQRTALDSADRRYKVLEQDYDELRADLREVREATALLIDVFDRFLIRLRPSKTGETYTAIVQLSELGEARRTVNEARRHLL